MMDFLDSLIDRHRNAPPRITPRIPSIYEPENSYLRVAHTEVDGPIGMDETAVMAPMAPLKKMQEYPSSQPIPNCRPFQTHRSYRRLSLNRGRPTRPQALFHQPWKKNRNLHGRSLRRYRCFLLQPKQRMPARPDRQIMNLLFPSLAIPPQSAKQPTTNPHLCIVSQGRIIVLSMLRPIPGILSMSIWLIEISP